MEIVKLNILSFLSYTSLYQRKSMPGINNNKNSNFKEST